MSTALEIVLMLSIPLAAPSAPGAGDASALRLVPFPKEVALAEGSFRLDRPLWLRAEPSAAATASALLGEELRAAGLDARIELREDGAPRTLAITGAPSARPEAPELAGGHGPEEYVLAIVPESIVARGAGREGLLHAIQTLRQLVRANLRDRALPALAIRDWPSLRWRAFQDDITRGPSSTLEELCRQASVGAYLKQNVFTYYMQTQFAFRKHPDVGPPDGSLTGEELAELVRFAEPLGVEILGNQQSFAHMQDLLRLDRYAALREDGRTLSPVREGTYRLLDDLYSEVIPLLPFEFFNVCCDETWNLGSGPSKDLAREIGVAGVYLRHILRVHDLVHGKYGKRMMMWGDIILQHPERIPELPRDLVLLTWGYDRRESFEDQIVPFVRSGLEFMVCPGVKCWGEVLPNFETAAINIRNFVRDGAKHGAIGVLNTSWDDDGENLNAPSWHGFAWGAECAWNASATSYDDFQRRVGAALFGERGARFGQAIEALSAKQAKGYDGLTNGTFWIRDSGPLVFRDARKEIAACDAWIADVRRPIADLEAVRAEARANRGLLDAFLHGARRFELLGARRKARVEAALAWREALGLPGPEAAAALGRAAAAVRGTRETLVELREGWKTLWLRENRPYALDRCLARYDEAIAAQDRALAAIGEARAAAERGETVPDPGATGLEVLELGRRLAGARAVPEPLRPDAPWTEAGATHRLGLVLEGAAEDRADVPVEIELRIPAELARSPVRAYREAAAGQPGAEVPAQIERAGGDGGGTALLTLVLPGILPAGRETELRVYLGLGEAPPPHPSAVRVSEAPGGARWIENDRVRLLLSPEGGHIYRWEVRGAGGLDLTLPGESGYAGFSDLGGHRRAAECALVTVAAGPAVATLDVREPSGFTRTVRAFAGASWIEVLLDEAVPYYWDFDDPEKLSGGAASPARYLFSTGETGAVRRLEDGADSQVASAGATWVVKSREDGLALGLATPDGPSALEVGPGGTWGGVGVEGSPGAARFATFGGIVEGDPGKAMRRLAATLDGRRPPRVRTYALETR